MLVSLTKLLADRNLWPLFRWIAFISPNVALREPKIVNVSITVIPQLTICTAIATFPPPPHTRTHTRTRAHVHRHSYKHTTNTFIYTCTHALTLVIDLQLSSCQQVVQLTGYSEEMLSVHTHTYKLTHTHYTIVSSG